MQLVDSGKTVLLVTHELRFLQRSDQVLVIDHGAIKYSGRPDTLVEAGYDCQTLGHSIKSHTTDKVINSDGIVSKDVSDTW